MHSVSLQLSQVSVKAIQYVCVLHYYIKKTVSLSLPLDNASIICSIIEFCCYLFINNVL